MREGGRERKRPLLLCENLRGFGDLVSFHKHLNPLRGSRPSCECVSMREGEKKSGSWCPSKRIKDTRAF